MTAPETFPISREAYDQFLEDLFERTPDSYDDDAAAESIAVDYVRDLEGLVSWLLDRVIVVSLGGDDFTVHGRLLPDEFRRLVIYHIEARLPEASVYDGNLVLNPVDAS